ncbi:MAG: acyl-CoA dehydrogenase family protein, partial [Rhizobiales bacterium]|nr:acyl-CoA dehydrogenase family protein [Hyphomicrobiales bacterium]
MRDITALPFFAPAHRDLCRRAAAIAKDLTGRIDHHDVDGSCRRLVKDFAKEGLLRLSVPETRHDVRSLCLIRESMAYEDGLADFAFAMQGLGSGPIVLFGTDEQKKRWLPQVASGDALAAFAITEPE